MKRLTKLLRRALRSTLSQLVRFPPVKALFTAWYRTSLKCLPLLVKDGKTRQVKTVFTRHQNWIVGISDIDLIILYDSLDPDRDRTMFVTFWRRYLVLRLFFPMLCWISEIRWIPLDALEKHPMHRQPEVHLLASPEQWQAIYDRPGEHPSETPVFNPPFTSRLPLTVFLEYNLYGYIQRQVFSSGKQPGLRVERMAKCAMKIIQHLHFLETGQYHKVQDLKQLIANPPSREPWQRYRGMIGGLLPEAGQEAHDEAMVRSVFNLVTGLSRAHEAVTPVEAPATEPFHKTPGNWPGSGLDRFLHEAGQEFGDRLRLVAFSTPYYKNATRLFYVIGPGESFEAFYRFVRFARNYHGILSNERVILNATTPALLTSQFYGLWGHFALEPQIMLARGVYAPRGGFEMKHPPEEWTLQKIRESVAMFEEYYLPFMMSPRAKGEGMDFCKIYERTETEMLFHYFCYLKDKDAYLETMERSGGSGDEVITLGCARYGNEIGIQDWHPFRYVDAYPYMKSMIRHVDEMALRQLESSPSNVQFST